MMHGDKRLSFDEWEREQARLEAEREIRKARRAEKLRLKAEREAAAQLRNQQKRLEREKAREISREDRGAVHPPQAKKLDRFEVYFLVFVLVAATLFFGALYWWKGWGGVALPFIIVAGPIIAAVGVISSLVFAMFASAFFAMIQEYTGSIILAGLAVVFLIGVLVAMAKKT